MPAGCLNKRETHPTCKLKQLHGRGGVSAVRLVSCLLEGQVLDKGDFFVVLFFGNK